MLFGEAGATDEQLETLVRHMRKRLCDDGEGPMSAEVSQVIDLARLTSDSSLCRHLEDADTVAPILEDWVAEATGERLGHFPRGAGLDELEPEYDDWWASRA